ncbi:hypothetical protein CEY00_Acc03650 [Actinidia chinensis var. chinensis]|uniref:Uncharacterized protein n=1 Tax=Actinidia chinensis var. chinensis TaxID=1590841 RepID=A0A2R6RTB7_ACTCC|nr:hypothetical protein CEY00_Acc03650 [Actinidia chinensis var. chinensis]
MGWVLRVLGRSICKSLCQSEARLHRIPQSKAKMPNGGHLDLPHKFLQIKQDDKFFSRILSKEKTPSSKAESSFRVLYYGGSSGSVPFTWESQPGTPKHHSFSDTSLPPLTPPPSYLANPKKPKFMRKSTSKLNFLSTLFPRITLKKIKNHLSSPEMSSSSMASSGSSNSYSLTPTPVNSCVHRSWFLSRSRSTVRFWVDEVEDEQGINGSPAPTLCFGVRHGVSKANMKSIPIVNHGEA